MITFPYFNVIKSVQQISVSIVIKPQGNVKLVKCVDLQSYVLYFFVRSNKALEWTQVEHHTFG